MRSCWNNQALADTAADVNAEMADSNNRRYWLYKNDPNWAVTDIRPPEDGEDGENVYHAFAAEWREYCRGYSVGRHSEESMCSFVEHNRNPDAVNTITSIHAFGRNASLNLTEEMRELWDRISPKVQYRKDALFTFKLWVVNCLTPESNLRSRYATMTDRLAEVTLLQRIMHKATTINEEGQQVTFVFGLPIDVPIEPAIREEDLRAVVSTEMHRGLF
ncbi:hypothetical protein IV203_030276 [Nitzschia inconspicua]|uniref:Uncharacterized protein n=1 Tax=Nitzschia inconspicua TaxID=303405 RepID=A0A9K3LTG3_9STRA|nr:hypothetical protein IV203_030276 [Nitzschia inconspicua]